MAQVINIHDFAIDRGRIMGLESDILAMLCVFRNPTLPNSHPVLYAKLHVLHNPSNVLTCNNYPPVLKCSLYFMHSFTMAPNKSINDSSSIIFAPGDLLLPVDSSSSISAQIIRYARWKRHFG